MLPLNEVCYLCHYMLVSVEKIKISGNGECLSHQDMQKN